jgi:uncharacterized protein
MQTSVITEILSALKASDCPIQVILGPRQVGKTTAALEIQKRSGRSVKYISADDVISASRDWLYEQWYEARATQGTGLLIIDEIQKISGWSESIKKLWDEQKREKTKIKLVILGSSSLDLHEGLSESLAGRFELHTLYQWGWPESQTLSQMSLDDYLRFGGYPGSYEYIKDQNRWRNYVRNSIVNAVIDKDILASVRVKSPALFRQSFELFMSYPAQEISYNKLLGQLQDKGNIDLVKYYLQIFEQAFMLKCVYKYSGKKLVSKTSSPKIIPMCPALVQCESEYEEAGRIFEACVGADLLKKTQRVWYWREASAEVDYIIEDGKNLFALEVKSGRKRGFSGLAKFKDHFPKAQLKVITKDEYGNFTKDPVAWLRR